MQLPSDVLLQLHIAALAYTASAAEELVGLIREVETIADGDWSQLEARLPTLVSTIASRGSLSVLACSTRLPSGEITLSEDNRGLVLEALAYQRKRLVNELLDPGRAGSNSELIEDIRLLTSFLLAAGVDLAATNGDEIHARRIYQGGPDSKR
jgi:hypothetical protein